MITKQEICRLYVEEKISASKIAKMNDAPSKYVIYRILKREGIERRATKDYPSEIKGVKFTSEHSKRIGESRKKYFASLTKEERARPERYNRLTYFCTQCQKEIIKPVSYFNNKKLIYCSKICLYNYQKTLIGVDNPRFKSIAVKCGFCKNKIWKQPAIVKRTKHQFCNRVCSGNFDSKYRRGKNSRAFGGGIAVYGESWHTQRRLALLRDNHTCQRCFATKEKLGVNPDVHHIKPFLDFGRERHEEANDLNNLVTLCRSCHRIVEPDNGAKQRKLNRIYNLQRS